MEIITKAAIEDAVEIAEIYNYYIENSTITFEEETISRNEMMNRIATINEQFPFICLKDNNQLLGYAYATSWKARSAYKYSAEVTIYLKNNVQRKGYGSILLGTLISELKKTDIHVLVGGIALPNDASIALHEKFGFKKVAQFEDIGYKFEKWIDVGYWELKL